MIDLDELVSKAKAQWGAMTPEQRRDMLRQQAISYGRAEAGFGSDADEAEYAAALASGEPERIAEVKLEEALRVARYDEIRGGK
jgi:hypothetical protein